MNETLKKLYSDLGTEATTEEKIQFLANKFKINGAKTKDREIDLVAYETVAIYLMKIGTKNGRNKRDD